MEAFQQHVPDRVPRRVLLIMPFAFAGLVAISRRSERRLPDPRAGGAGDWITLVVFSVFSVLYLKQPVRWNHAVGFAMIVAAVGVIFKQW